MGLCGRLLRRSRRDEVGFDQDRVTWLGEPFESAKQFELPSDRLGDTSRVIILALGQCNACFGHNRSVVHLRAYQDEYAHGRALPWRKVFGAIEKKRSSWLAEEASPQGDLFVLIGIGPQDHKIAGAHLGGERG